MDGGGSSNAINARDSDDYRQLDSRSRAAAVYKAMYLNSAGGEKLQK